MGTLYTHVHVFGACVTYTALHFTDKTTSFLINVS